ncbi:N-acetylmuramoyl-L-alanine amidase [Niallia nealsonii]|uniref:N-acetylmuramoyl-L-alanine amidase n=1 Tax=Niallia nealsonii TaxID=115979 RepID=A0A2N0Z4K3_9BACI|nr:N-acetylmuramoyl-L-alanine amidase [Niallia nealsonii]PKG24436.1 N-acetylmuramoyl-L-alanine amidase [Niallia nealsonii]
MSRIGMILLAFFVSFLFIPLQEIQAESSENAISSVVVNIRESPSLDALITDKMEISKEYPIIRTQGDWVELQLPEGKSGWVASYLVVKEEKRTDETNDDNYTDEHHSSATIASVLEDAINVRLEPTTSSAIIGKLAKDTQIHIVGEQGEWTEIQYSGNKGWIKSSLLQHKEDSNTAKTKDKATTDKDSKRITILYNRTNIRSNATVNSTIVSIANEGDSFPVIKEIGDWYKIRLSNGSEGYVANWIVDTPSITKDAKSDSPTASKKKTKKGNKKDLKGKVIVIDPGHGGKDSGTIGYLGTLEKNLTNRTANLLAAKLRSAGSKVILTRTDDTFLSLEKRVEISSTYDADAFVSIHYDSVKDHNIMGMTSYYYTSRQKELANELHAELIEATNMIDRGVRKNDYFVLRENSQPATLLELGYLSNQQEEKFVSTNKYQETVSAAIYQGLANYFK